MWDVIIVGAGPVGCRAGELVAKKGFKVLIIDKKKEIGKPVRCSALVSHRIFDLTNVSKDVVVNVVERAKIYSNSGNCLEVKSKRPVYVMDREKFDKEIGRDAKNAGAKIRMLTALENFKKEKDYLRVKTTKGLFVTKLLVGADGPNSMVAHTANIPLPDNLLVAVQRTVKSSYDSDAVELWFGSNVCPSFFCWVIPENERWARIGLASSRSAMKYLENFIRNRVGKKIRYKDELSGLIRFGLMKDTVSDRVLLVGAAASQTKPFSGGGLTYGQIGAKYCAEACIKSLKEGRYGHEFLKKNYDEKWGERLAWSIKKGWFLNRLTHVSDLLFDFSIGVGKLSKFILEEIDMDLLD